MPVKVINTTTLDVAQARKGEDKKKRLIYLEELPWGMAFMINVGVDYATNSL